MLKKDGCCCLRRSCSVAGRSSSVVNCSFSSDAACTEKLYLLVRETDRHRRTQTQTDRQTDRRIGEYISLKLFYLDRQTDRLTDRRDTGRQAGRQAGRQTDTDRATENSNSKTLFYKDCSLGSVKNLTTSPC